MQFVRGYVQSGGCVGREHPAAPQVLLRWRKLMPTLLQPVIVGLLVSFGNALAACTFRQSRRPVET